MDYLVLKSYLSPLLFLKMKTFVGLSMSYWTSNNSELSSFPKFLLIHDPKIKNIGYI